MVKSSAGQKRKGKSKRFRTLIWLYINSLVPTHVGLHLLTFYCTVFFHIIWWPHRISWCQEHLIKFSPQFNFQRGISPRLGLQVRNRISFYPLERICTLHKSLSQFSTLFKHPKLPYSFSSFKQNKPSSILFFLPCKRSGEIKRFATPISWQKWNSLLQAPPRSKSKASRPGEAKLRWESSRVSSNQLLQWRRQPRKCPARWRKAVQGLAQPPLHLLRPLLPPILIDHSSQMVIKFSIFLYRVSNSNYKWSDLIICPF